jgi:hypothetical protein
VRRYGCSDLMLAGRHSENGKCIAILAQPFSRKVADHQRHPRPPVRRHKHSPAIPPLTFLVQHGRPVAVRPVSVRVEHWWKMLARVASEDLGISMVCNRVIAASSCLLECSKFAVNTKHVKEQLCHSGFSLPLLYRPRGASASGRAKKQ